MLKSMTGFGRSEKVSADYSFKAEIRSVNNRFIEINARIPKFLSQHELALKKLVKSHCSRGTFDLTISLESLNGSSSSQEIKANLPQASQYLNAFKEIKNELGIQGDIDINSLLGLRDILKTEAPNFDASQVEIIFEVAEEAILDLIRTREREGQDLESDILSRIDEIGKLAESIVSCQPQIIEDYRERLRKKIKTLSEGIELDEARLAQETAIMADRIDVSEEITRLNSHLQHFRALAKTGKPLGRKLEFITQEINRETNTIGSKSTDYQISQTVIEIKSLLEKIREQIQNIE
ncbi:MAG: YicC family protein [Nitrospinae bacterium]|nr:YicC family protein [Nitrospinota bacterium]